MGCMLCLLFESTLARLERMHGETLEAMKMDADVVKTKIDRLRILERNARLDAEMLRRELNEHKRTHAKASQAR